MSIYDSKAVTQINLDEIFAKFGPGETKFMKKIWALRARNTGLGQLRRGLSSRPATMGATTRFLIGALGMALHTSLLRDNYEIIISGGPEVRR